MTNRRPRGGRSKYQTPRGLQFVIWRASYECFAHPCPFKSARSGLTGDKLQTPGYAIRLCVLHTSKLMFCIPRRVAFWLLASMRFRHLWGMQFDFWCFAYIVGLRFAPRPSSSGLAADQNAREKCLFQSHSFDFLGPYA